MMADLETSIPCPRCGRDIRVLLAEIRPENTKLCPGCGTSIRFSGADAGKVQDAISQLDSLGPGVSVKVNVNVKSKKPWWRSWS
jgi:hypothetical protein